MVCIPTGRIVDGPYRRPFSLVHQKQKFRVPAVEELLRFATRGEAA